jgi:hypothetical protein
MSSLLLRLVEEDANCKAKAATVAANDAKGI